MVTSWRGWHCSSPTGFRAKPSTGKSGRGAAGMIGCTQPRRIAARSVARRVAECCAAYGLEQGPVHAEVRVHEGEAWLLEVAARTIGGECARLLSFGTGCSLEELVLRQALGLDIAQTEMRGAAGVLMLPTPRAGVLRRVEGVMQAQALRGVDEVSIAVREGYRLEPLPEGNTYLGFVFASGDDPAEVEMTLRRAHAYLEVVIAPLFPVTAQPRV